MPPERLGYAAAMSDLAGNLGSTVTCPSCGAQVPVPGDLPGGLGAVACPKCGAAVHTGAPSYADDEDLTVDEAVRAVAAIGHDVDMTRVGDAALRCGECAAEVGADRLAVAQLRAATDVVGGGRTVVVAAVTCPACGAAGRVEVDPDPAGPDAALLAPLGLTG
jgi:transcription elongation factor Elf1